MNELAGRGPILLVDDDAIDAEMVKRCLKRANIGNAFYTALDGVDALEMLKGNKDWDSFESPCLILLDINMPRMNGLELLQRMREDETLKRHIVFILTTSQREADKKDAYDQNVAGYILKKNINDLASVLSRYCQINEFPPA